MAAFITAGLLIGANMLMYIVPISMIVMVIVLTIDYLVRG